MTVDEMPKMSGGKLLIPRCRGGLFIDAVYIGQIEIDVGRVCIEYPE
jgi:hypothetical protein